MDLATLVFMIVAGVFFMIGVVMDGTNPMSLLNIPALLIVVFPTLCVGFMGYLMKDTAAIMQAFKNALFPKVQAHDEAIATVVQFAEQARREGLLSLEESAKQIDDPFLRKGIELAVDGTDPEELREILETEIASKKSRDKIGVKFFTDLGAYAPTLGIMGAVVGLIHVLESLSDPAKAGAGIAAAFVATLYGVGLANMLFFPVSKKLARVAEIENHHMELLLEGVVSIQAGSNPRVIEQKLLAYLPAKEREALGEKAA